MFIQLELNIKATLDDALNEFLQVESLEGDNRYEGRTERHDCLHFALLGSVIAAFFFVQLPLRRVQCEARRVSALVAATLAALRMVVAYF